MHLELNTVAILVPEFKNETRKKATGSALNGLLRLLIVTWFYACDLHYLPSYLASCEKYGELQGATTEKWLVCRGVACECVRSVDGSLTEKVFGY